MVGSRPSRARCVGVSGISERSSFGPNNGYNAIRIFRTKKRRNTKREMSGYVWKFARFCNRTALKTRQHGTESAEQLTHYDLKLSPIKKVIKRAAPFHASFFILRSLNVAAFCLLTISSRRGWRHFPGS